MTLFEIWIRKKVFNPQGQSLVQVLVSIGIMAIISLAFMSMMSDQIRETKALTEKLASLEFQQQLTKSLMDGNVCTSLLSGKVFNSNTATQASVNKPSIVITESVIPISTAPSAPAFATAGAQVSPISTSLMVNPTSPFRVVDIVGTSTAGVGRFTGYFQIEFDRTRLIRPLKPVKTLVWIETTAVGSIWFKIRDDFKNNSAFGGSFVFTNGS